ncbi:MAG: DMT family transporter [Planctomycetes bacterium]|nr:DMT family transporter [Planctomycetota bacterium]
MDDPPGIRAPTPTTGGAARVPRLQILAAGLLFSTGGAAIKGCAGLGPFEVAGLRSAIAAVTIALLIPASRRGFDLVTLGTSFSYAATLVLYALANRLTTAANAIFLQSTAPLYLIALGPLLLREHARRRDLAVLAVLAVGMSLFFVGVDDASATAPRPALGNMLGAATGLTWALTLLGLRAAGRRGAVGGGNPAAAASLLGNVVAFTACAPLFEGHVGDAGATDWLVLGYLGTCQVGLAYALISKAVPRLPAFEVSLILMIEPACNPIWALLVHGEVPNPLAALGGAVILVALAVKTIVDTRRR